MRRNGNKKIIILALFICTLFMGVGYALLSQSLSITDDVSFEGKWNIYIDSIEATTIGGKAISKNVKIGSDKLSAVFTVDLYGLGDYVIYTIKVKNAGNINAKLNSVVPTITNGSPYIIMSNSLEADDRIGEVLEANNEMIFTVKIAVDDSNGELQDVEGSKYKIQLNFLQN
ncbi:MAG: hypothetical protein PUD59_05920 [bacterium]|nr:hypothetical protein [bacterium]